MLTVKNLTKAFADRTVLSDFSCTLGERESLAILGPSGSGKSTFLKCIAGFESGDRGEILWGATPLWSKDGKNLPPEERKLGMVFQDYALFPHLTAEENIGFGIRNLERSAKHRSVDEWVERFSLQECRKSYPHELSGGEQQRVALARALAVKPRLLLLDESFSALDAELRPRIAGEVRNLLRELGVASILVTHDQHEAFAFADRVVILDHGKLQQLGTPYELYHEPANAFVAEFVGDGVLLPIRYDRKTFSISCELGPIEAKQAARAMNRPLSPGEEFRVLIRPDDLLHDDRSPLRLKVLSREFRGSHFLYTLELPSGAHALSEVPSHHDHAVGTNIGFKLVLDHVVMVPMKKESKSALLA